MEVKKTSEKKETKQMRNITLWTKDEYGTVVIDGFCHQLAYMNQYIDIDTKTFGFGNETIINNENFSISYSEDPKKTNRYFSTGV